jgi:hypothetical protein
VRSDERIEMNVTEHLPAVDAAADVDRLLWRRLYRLAEQRCSL